ncbi:MAG: hypothetical protein KAR45_20565, partial [Desulfobacteraceae bacterium]|nr:hypothetical protein [Desulfobacteraceae bacterium]
MIPINADITSLTKQGYFGQASILDFCDEKYRVKISSDTSCFNGTQVWAKPALAFPCELKWGDTVLLAGDSMEALFIIGIIKSRAIEKSLVLEDGTNVKAENSNGFERLKIYSKQGEMIFEYDSETKKSSVNIQEGDLEFITQNG